MYSVLCTRYSATRLLRTFVRALTACPRSHAPTELRLRARHHLFSPRATHSDNPNPSRSGKKSAEFSKSFQIPRAFPDFAQNTRKPAPDDSSLWPVSEPLVAGLPTEPRRPTADV